MNISHALYILPCRIEQIRIFELPVLQILEVDILAIRLVTKCWRLTVFTRQKTLSLRQFKEAKYNWKGFFLRQLASSLGMFTLNDTVKGNIPGEITFWSSQGAVP